MEETVKEWVQVDNEIREHQAKLAELRQTRSELETRLHGHATDRGLSNPTIGISDGYLKLGVTTVRPSVSLKLIRAALEDVGQTADQINAVMEGVANRRIGTAKSIVRRGFADVQPGA